MQDEELQSKINGLLSKLPGNFSAEIIDDSEPIDAQSVPDAEQPSESGDTLPPEILEMIGAAIKESFEAANVIPIAVHCYHYILNNTGEPVYCKDGDKIKAFEKRNGHIVALESFYCSDFHCQVMTSFAVHNTMIGDTPPKPRWQTELIKVNTGEISIREYRRSLSEAMELHRATCIEAQRRIDKINKKSEAHNE